MGYLSTAFASVTNEVTRYKVLTKGRIEWLIPEKFTAETSIIKASLDISERSLDELERNLIYKTSDRIHLIVFENYHEYQRYFADKSDLRYLYNPYFETNLIGSVYHPILLTGNNIDIEYQIRRATARQFLNEFLLGFTYRDRFTDPIYQNTPLWLTSGFVEYFAGGITREDFLQFKAQSKNNAFRNLNFIDPQNQILFGKVLWYFFEKEKGRNLNSVFWTLIKFAENFENSFQYHFNLPFKQWLDAKITELQQSEPFLSNESDAFIEIENDALHKAQFLFEPLTESALVTVTSDKYEEAYLWQTKEQSKQLLLKHKLLSESPFPKFHETSWAYDESKRDWICLYFKGDWQIRTSDMSFSLPKASRYKLVKITGDTAILLKEIPGETYLEYYSLQNKSLRYSRLLNPESFKIDELYFEADNRIFAIIHKREIHNSSAKIIEFCWSDTLSNFALKYIYQDFDVSSFQNAILENESKFSFIANYATEDAVYHFDKQKSAKVLAKTPTKGLSYQQVKIPNTEKFIEFYIAKNRWNINKIDLITPIFDSDTFVRVALSFDTAHLIDSITFKKKTYPNELKLTPPYQPKLHSKTTFIPSTHNTNKQWSQTPFNPWFYLHRSNFYLSNSDFSTPYDGRVSPTQQYNSPLTFFFKNTFLEVSNKQRFDIELFSNLNRRRIGLQLLHKIIGTKNRTYTSKFSYRLRQYNDNNTTNFRNRSVEFCTTVEQHHQKWNTSISGEILNSQIIALNNAKEKVITPTSTRWLLQIPLHLKTYGNTSNRAFQNIQYVIDNKFTIGTIYHQNEWIPTLSLGGDYAAKGSLYLFQWKSKASARYSITKSNVSYMLGGQQGWISQSANTDILYNRLRDYQNQFWIGGLPIRGLPVASRVGNSFLHMQYELGLPLLRLFPNSLKERVFWKSMVIYGFFDAGLAFYGNLPSHHSNPYNTRIINTPNYTLRASTRQNPWISGTGIGAQMNILGYPFRIEYAQGRLGAIKTPPRLLLSLGKNF
jgi:hypothetical protein